MGKLKHTQKWSPRPQRQEMVGLDLHLSSLASESILLKWNKLNWLASVHRTAACQVSPWGQDGRKSHLSPPGGQSWREVSEENTDFSSRGVSTQPWPWGRQEVVDLILGMSRASYRVGFRGEGETFKAQNKSQSGRLKLLRSAKGTGWSCRNFFPFLSCLSFMEQPS